MCRRLSPAIYDDFNKINWYNISISHRPEYITLERLWHLTDPVGLCFQKNCWDFACMDTLLNFAWYCKYTLTNGSLVTWVKTAVGSGQLIKFFCVYLPLYVFSVYWHCPLAGEYVHRPRVWRTAETKADCLVLCWYLTGLTETQK